MRGMHGMGARARVTAWRFGHKDAAGICPPDVREEGAVGALGEELRALDARLEEATEAKNAEAIAEALAGLNAWFRRAAAELGVASAWALMRRVRHGR